VKVMAGAMLARREAACVEAVQRKAD